MSWGLCKFGDLLQAASNRVYYVCLFSLWEDVLFSSRILFDFLSLCFRLYLYYFLLFRLFFLLFEIKGWLDKEKKLKKITMVWNNNLIFTLFWSYCYVIIYEVILHLKEYNGSFCYVAFFESNFFMTSSNKYADNLAIQIYCIFISIGMDVIPQTIVVTNRESRYAILLFRQISSLVVQL